MTSTVRLRLTLLYVAAIMVVLVIVGSTTYWLVQQYFQTVTDLALRHKMAHEYASMGLTWTKELADADAYWSTIRKTVLPDAFVKTVSQQRQVTVTKGNAAWYPQSEIELEELYDGELAAIILLPLNEQGQVVSLNAENKSPAKANGLFNRATLDVATQSGFDLRTVRMDTGADVRLLTYRLPPGKPVTYLQLVRALDDQSFVLNSLLEDLAGFGVISALLAGAGSWWLAGRSLKKEHLLWERQQTFVANASHELRTPLTLIRANAEIIQRKLPKDDEAQFFLADVLSETDYMNKLVSDLLLLSRLDAHQVKLSLQRIAVAALFASVQRQLEPLFTKKGLTLAIKDSAGFAWADPDRLRQILLILLDNARCYTPEGGTVTLGFQIQAETVEVEVVDTGVGIPAQHLPKVFDRFYQANQTAPKRCEDRGSGLGLPIAKALIEAHGGNIHINSVVGKGTRIVLSWPVSPKLNQPASAAQRRFFTKPAR